MATSKLASSAAVLGGLAWLAAAILAWGEEEPVTPLYWVGAVGMVVALAAGGYALVATAPIWLRGVVTVATAVLGWMVWSLVADSLGADDVVELAGGLALLVGGIIGYMRAEKSAAPPGPARSGRHVTR